MLNEYRSVDALVNGITGTTSFISSLVSAKTGMAITLIVLGVFVTKVLLG